MIGNLVHISNKGGHRKAYLDLFVGLFGFEPLIMSLSKKCLKPILGAKRVLFATANKDFKYYFLLSFLRAVLVRPTVTILLYDLKNIEKEKQLVAYLNLFVLKIWKLLPKQSTFSIISYTVEPRLSGISSGYIYDPQLWDIFSSDTSGVFERTELSELVIKNAAGRKVLIYLGAGKKSKSFDKMASFGLANKKDVLIVSAGVILKDSLIEADLLRDAGMIVIDRFISDEELISLYGVADYVWCAYSNENDQSSGIFGRSIQLGRLPIIRKGAIVERIALDLGVPYYSLELDSDYEESYRELSNSSFVQLSEVERNNLFKALKLKSLVTLKKALYIN